MKTNTNKVISPQMILLMIEDARQLSFRVSEHAKFLVQQQEKIESISHGLNAILSLQTVVKEKSKNLDEKIEQMKAIF